MELIEPTWILYVFTVNESTILIHTKCQRFNNIFTYFGVIIHIYQFNQSKYLYIGSGNLIFSMERKTGFWMMYSPCFIRVSIVLYTLGTKRKSSRDISIAFVRPNAWVAQLPFTRRCMSLTNCSAPKSTIPSDRPRSVISSSWWRIGEVLGTSVDAYLFNSSMKIIIRSGISESARSVDPNFRLGTVV